MVATWRISMERCLEIPKSELLRDMALTGCASVADITQALIKDKVATTAML